MHIGWNPSRSLRGLNHWVLVSLFVLSIVASSTAQSPARITLHPQSGTVRVGEQISIRIDFLSRAYQPTKNDRTRSVEFAVRATGTNGGAGDISPTRIRVGALSEHEVSFKATRRGKVEVIANSPGLQPARIVLNIVTQTSFRFNLVPTAIAQSPMRIEILPRDNPILPANGVSRAVLYVTLDRVLQPGERLLIRLQAIPGCTIVYKGERAVAVKQIAIGDGNAQSEEIQILSSRPGAVHVSAQVISGQGGRDETVVQFERPRPVKVLFDEHPESIDSSLANFPVDMRIGDQDQQPVADPPKLYKIVLQPLSDLNVVHFSPDRVTIDQAHPAAQSLIRLGGVPASGSIVIRATDQRGLLEPAQKTIILNSYLKSVVLDGPKEVHRGRTARITVHFADAENKHRKADWTRTVDFTSTDGWFEPSKVQFLQASESAQVIFHASNSVKTVSLTASSTGLEPGSLNIQVVTPVWLLMLFSAIGGMIGGLARLTKERIQQILPQRTAKGWELGLLANTMMSFVFGLVLFIAVRGGLLSLPSGIGLELGSRSIAFLFGVVGGFAGVYVLDKLVERVLGAPAPKADVADAPKEKAAAGR